MEKKYLLMAAGVAGIVFKIKKAAKVLAFVFEFYS